MKRKSTDDRAGKAASEEAQSTLSVPLPPPTLLERAKKLGAISAGPALITAEGAVLAGVAPAGHPVRIKQRSAPSKAKSTKRKSSG